MGNKPVMQEECINTLLHLLYSTETILLEIGVIYIYYLWIIAINNEIN